MAVLDYEVGSIADVFVHILEHCGYIRSDPNTGEYLVTGIYLDSDKKIVFRYDTDAED